MSNKRKKLGLRNLPVAKHAETYSSEESAKFQPWKVTLKVILRPEDLTPVDYIMYVREANPNYVQWVAYIFFQKIFGLDSPKYQYIDPNTIFPKVCTDIPSECECITEQEYMSEWKEAQKWPKASIGDRRNPSMFRYAPPGWDNGILEAPKSSIIVPDKSSLEHIAEVVEKTKNRK